MVDLVKMNTQTARIAKRIAKLNRRNATVDILVSVALGEDDGIRSRSDIAERTDIANLTEAEITVLLEHGGTRPAAFSRCFELVHATW